MSLVGSLEAVLAALSRDEPVGEITPAMIDAFCRIEFFRSFITKGMEKMVGEVIRNLHLTRFRKFEPIFFKGDRSTRFYIVAQGSVLIMLPDRSKEKTKCSDPELERAFFKDPRFFDQKTGSFLQNIVSKVQPGTTFGELGMLNGKPRLATAVAASDCVLLSLNVDEFRSILKPSMQHRVDGKNKFFKSLFADYCNFEEIWRLSAYFEANECHKGTVLAVEGDEFTQVFFVAQGCVELSKQLVSTQGFNGNLTDNFRTRRATKINLPVIAYGQNQLVGFKEVTDNLQRFFFTVKAVEDSTIYAISATNLRKCLQEFPGFGRYFQEKAEIQNRKLSVR